MGPLANFQRKFQKTLDRVSNRLDQENKQRHFEQTTARPPRLQKIFAGCIAILFVLLAGNELHKLLSWPPAEYSSSAVFNLTKSGVTWDRTVGNFEQCDGGSCYFNFEATQLIDNKVVTLPEREFPLNGYESGDILYTTVVRLPDNFVNNNEPMVLHTIYVWADEYQVYIDGELRESGAASALHASISSRDTQDGSIKIEILVKPGQQKFQGVANYGDLVIGPVSLLAPLKNRARELETSYFLWFLIPRVTLGIVFAFIFMTISRNRENFTLLLFITLGSVPLYFSSHYGKQVAANVPYLHDFIAISRMLGTCILVLFFHQYFRLASRNFSKILAISAITLSAAITFVQFSGLFAYPDLTTLRINTGLRVFALVYGLVLAGLTAAHLHMTGRSKARFRACLWVAGFIAASLPVIIIHQLGFTSGVFGVAFVYMHELVLAILLAGLTSAEFGNSVRQRDHVTSQLKKYVDKVVAERLINREQVVKPQRTDVAVMFADIRGFTTLVENLPAEDVMDLLSEYLTAMVNVIDEHMGVIDKFGGDSIMAYWDGTKEAGDACMLAASCAVEMRGALNKLNASRRDRGLCEISIGIGINFGSAIVGPVGADTRTDYTIIGDAVNVAARLESLTKELQVDICISDSCWQQSRERLVVANGGVHRVKGKSRDVVVFQLLAYQKDDNVMVSHGLDASYGDDNQPQVRDELVINLIQRDYQELVAAATDNELENLPQAS